MSDNRPSKERFTPEYISEVVKELESRGWRPDSRGDPECCDEASAAGAQIIEHLQNLLKLETAALEQACAAPVDSPMTVEQARATDEPSVTPDAWMSEDGRIISRDAKEFGSRHPTAKSASDPFTIPLYRAAVPPSVGWISVHDRLPVFTEDPREHVLVYSATHDWLGSQFTVMQARDFYWPAEGEQMGTDDASTVTHWMPLPGAPVTKSAAQRFGCAMKGCANTVEIMGRVCASHETDGGPK